MPETDGGGHSRPAGLPLRLHHHAYTTDDHEANRRFYEDIVGLPLVAMYIERENIGGTWVELGHAFYGLADGGALAFFNFADPERQRAYRARSQSQFSHLSLAVDDETQEEIRSRVEKAGVRHSFIDHGYCRSLYFTDPNGLLLEFTVDPPHAADIHAEMRRTAHADLERWVKGDRSPNNQWRPEPAPATTS